MRRSVPQPSSGSAASLPSVLQCCWRCRPGAVSRARRELSLALHQAAAAVCTALTTRTHECCLPRRSRPGTPPPSWVRMQQLGVCAAITAVPASAEVCCTSCLPHVSTSFIALSSQHLHCMSLCAARPLASRLPGDSRPTSRCHSILMPCRQRGSGHGDDAIAAPRPQHGRGGGPW